MNNHAEMERLWKTLASDRVVMHGLAGDERYDRFTTAQLLHKDGERGPIWFLTAKDSPLTRDVGSSHLANLQLVSKGHDLFASVQGELFADNDQAAIDELWNAFVAASYEGAKEDPKPQLLRCEPLRAQVWLNDNSVVAEIKLPLGRDPRPEFAD